MATEKPGWPQNHVELLIGGHRCAIGGDRRFQVFRRHNSLPHHQPASLHQRQLKDLSPKVPPLPGWYAIIGPAGMDAKVVQKLAASINRFLNDPAVAAKLNDQFLAPIPGTPEGIQKRGENESQPSGSLIRELKIEAN